ncbi:PLDc N-terminal domain-containing protein [Pseudarthrobacter sulfonivorans]|uniref:PLDc N-terminal domain-containing protein n=1 Tax=Pseudarthrobacter sulfonivorans TaxID=121292 RepID=UPI002102C05C|nr:PLDc N-terminal domain-containing protein [Pseudarthrobacter sulfonivorans]
MAKKNKKTWKEMSPAARAGVVAAGIVQVSLMLAAQRDISRRPAAQINGPKAAWRAAALINFIGPIGYFILGRKRPDAVS